MASVTPPASYPPQNFIAVIPAPAPALGPAIEQVSSYQKILKGEPKALGTVQIMIGAVSLLFGIVLTTMATSLIFYTGYIIWASVLYISAGALTVTAAQSDNPCMIKGSLVMNVISAVAAGVTLVLLSFDVSLGLMGVHRDNREYGYDLLMQSRGISGALLIFCLLQFIISIFISGLACNSTHSNQPKGVYVVSNLDSTTTEVQYTLSAPELYPQTAIV